MQFAKYVRKLVVFAVGFPLLGLGLVLIPLPGPGLLTTALGLFILSYELAWAKRLYEKRRGELQGIYRQSKKRFAKATENE